MQDIEGSLWYNKCKGKDENCVKTLHMEGMYVSIQQWTDQSCEFQAASGHESEGEQPP